MIVHQNRHSTNSVQQSLVENSETKNNQHQFISHRMQQNTNEHFLSQHNNEFYTQSSHQHPHFQYQYESHSLSPQQSSTSDVEETSSSLTRTVTTKLIKKKKQTKKKRKDPNEPQKPVSPYALFFRDTQNDIKKKLPNPSFGEISKVVAHMWENIEPELKEQYKRNAASAKKEYLKQLAAYRAVQISHQTPTMHHILHQTSLPFNPHQQKHYHTGSMITNHHQPQRHFCPASSMQQYNNFHYVNPYTQDNSNAYHSDRSIHFPNHPQQTYSSYDSNNNYPDYQQYNLLRPVIESEHYSSYYSQSAIDHGQIKSNENLLHNSNNNTSPYTDLSSSINDKHYYPHHGLNDKKEDDHSSLIPISNENNFHWNQTTSSTTEW